MVLNNECVRALLLWLEANQKLRSNGLHEHIKIKSAYDALDFSKDDIHAAAKYLVEKKLVYLTYDRKATDIAPRLYTFASISATGYDYLAAVRDNNIWKKIKDNLGSVTLASVPTVIETAAKLLV